jgi:hypothetical protein
MSEEEARSKGIAILLVMSTDFGLSQWLSQFDQEAIENLKEAVIGIIRSDVPLSPEREWESKI